MSKKPTYEELEQKSYKLKTAESEFKLDIESIHEISEKFSVIFQQSPIAIEIYNSQGFLIDANSQCLQLFGVKDLEKVKNFRLFDDPNLPKDSIESLSQKKSVHYEHEFDFDLVKVKGLYETSKSGKAFLSVYINPLFDSDENLSGYLVQVEDITKSKKTEEALKKINTMLDSTGRMAKVGGWELDVKTLELTWTDETYRIHEVPLGYKPPLKEAINFFHPDDRPKLEEAINRAINLGEPYDMEVRFITANGNQLWTRTICQPELVDGETVKLIGTFQDITDRKITQNSLHAIEWLIKSSPKDKYSHTQPYGDLTVLNRERTILDNVGSEVLADIVQGYLQLLDTSAAVYERNGDYSHGIFSSGWCKMLDSASRELCGTNDNEAALKSGKWLCHESCWEDASKLSIQSGKPVDIECNGGLRIYAVPIKTNGDITGSINFGYGNPPKNIQSVELIAEKYQVDPKALLAEAEKYETRPKFIIEIAKKRLESSARLIGVLVENKKTQNDLGKVQKQLSNALEMARLAPWEYDVTTDTFTFNDYFYKVFGTTVREVGGYKMKPEEYANRFLYPDDIPRVREETKKAIESNDPNYKQRVEHRIIYSDGKIGHMSVQIFIEKDDNGNTIKTYGVNQDITVLKKTEEEKEELSIRLQQAHKMESIGTLAGGIAHDFNNILSPILMHSEMVMDDLPEDHLLQDNLKEIFKAGKRAGDLVQQILTFARKRSEKKIALRASLVVKETVKFLRSTIPTTIDIQYDIISNQDRILADPTQINQIVMNLCTNAAHAMKERGGVLEVILDNEEIFDEKVNGVFLLKPGKYLKLSVRDNGAGISPENMGRIFEPYYTTKSPGEGTGLGLAIIHGIVQNYGGNIVVESETGKGTAFHVYIPLIEADISDGKEENLIITGGTERILIVDDEAAILNVLQKMLTRLGYKVTGRSSVTEILEIFSRDPKGFDLVITDMTMPNMTGKELAVEIKRIRTDIPVILCTGFSDQIDQKETKKIGINGFIMKPISKIEMAKTIREVLDTPS